MVSHPARAALAGVLCAAFPAAAQVPHLLGYQGRLLRSDGTAATGTAAVSFSVFEAGSGGTPLWSETQTLGLSEGYYSTLLGLVAEPPETLFDGGDRWLEIKVGTETLAPRQRIGAVSYAVTSRNVGGGSAKVSSLEVAGQLVVDANGRLAGPARYGAGPGLAVDDISQTVSLGTCSAGQVMQHDGTTWRCTTAAVGSVTQVGATAPLSVTDATATPLLSMPQAGSGSAGYLSASDWSSFNSKYGALTQCGGDLSGMLSAPAVVRLQSRPVSAAAPAPGQVLKWAGSAWEPAADANAGGTVTHVGGNAPLTVWYGSTTPEISISQAGASADGFLSSSDWVRFEAKYQADTECAGDLYGALAAPKVVALQSRPVAPIAPSTGQILKWTGARWEPADDENAGGTVTRVQGIPPLQVWNEATTPQVSMYAADQASDGYLSSGDWTRLSSGTVG